MDHSQRNSADRTRKRTRKARPACCSFQPVVDRLEDRQLLSLTIANNLSTGAEVTTYRLAVAATAEFTALAGGVAQANSAIVGLVDQVNDVYGRELAIQFELVPNNSSIVFTNPATDGYTNGNVSMMLNENQGVVDGVIGSMNYDIGHVLGTRLAPGANGLAAIGVVGGASKAQGATIASDLDQVLGILLHEIGHQFDAEHTHNGNCANRDAATAFEPGSGSTIMASSACGADTLPEVAGDRDYFHANSFHEIISFIGTIPTVGVRAATGNAVPSVDAGPNRVIPASTPFELTATVVELNAGDAPTVTWEQIDVGGANLQSLPIPDAADGTGPLFRSLPPTSNLTRTFPRLADILANTAQATNVEEHLPTQDRVLNFRATVRDNHSVALPTGVRTISGVDSDDMSITVIDTGAPFQITSPNTAVNWTGGGMQTVTWNVAGTTGNGINAANVRILLSLDGGQTFPHLLATTSNDGSHQFIVPNIDTAAARLKIQGDGNIFFDLSDADFSIASNPAAPGVTIVESNGSTRIREDAVSLLANTDTYAIALNTFLTGTVQITIVADSQVEVSLDGVNFGPSRVVSLTSTTAATITVRAIDDFVGEGLAFSSVTHTVTASADVNYPVGMPVNEVTALVVDDERPPVVGVDLQAAVDGVTPENWSVVTSSIFNSTTANNLLREDGVTTAYDLTITPAVGASFGGGASDIDAATLPIHATDLTGVDGVRNWLLAGSNSVTATWSGLTPTAQYRVYVFAVENFGGIAANQTVTIAGATTLTPFQQVTTDRQLLINGEVGASHRTLESFGRTVAADANGEIDITVARNDGVDGNRIYLAALAIQEVTASTQLDFGDAPDPTYPTLQAQDGARHIIGPLFLGSDVDAENDGQPNATATGDDAAGNNNDDGLASNDDVRQGQTFALAVTASQAGLLDGWVDFNSDGDWNDTGEQVFTSRSLAAGVNNLSFGVPQNAVVGETFARLRLSSTGGLAPTGAATDGEVEDYLVEIQDGTPPTVVLAAPVTPTMDRTPTITITATDADSGVANGAQVQLDVDLNNDGGFTPNELGYDATTLSNGTVTFSLAPALANGTYRFRARAADQQGNAGASAVSIVTINSNLGTQVTAPAFFTQTLMPIVQWNAVNGASAYRLVISDLTTNSSVIDQVVANTSFGFANALTFGHRYRIWVQPRNDNGNLGAWSPNRDFVANTTSTPFAPQLTAPPFFTGTFTPTIDWTAVANATHYQLQVTNLTTNQPVLNRSSIPTNSFTFANALVAGNRYRVWVRAFNGVQPSVWSANRDFVVTAPLGLTAITAPTFFTGDTTPTVQWNSVANATGYQLQVLNVTTNQVIVANQIVNTTSFTFANPLTVGQRFRAWVRAVGANNSFGPWSSNRDFVITGGQAARGA